MTHRFEELLTHEAFREYVLSRYRYAWLRTEVDGTPGELAIQVSSDMLRYNELRKNIAKLLANESSEVSAVATSWIAYLKPRIEQLEYWAQVFSSTAALVVAGGGLLSVVNAKPYPFLSVVFAFSGTSVGLLLGLRRFTIDRRRLWYKYLCSHLEAIKAEHAAVRANPSVKGTSRRRAAPYVER